MFDIDVLYCIQVNIKRLPDMRGMIPVISSVLSSSQEFMKDQKVWKLSYAVISDLISQKYE